MAIIKVSPYIPKRMVCYNCHRIGHMSKYCPSQTVCRTCGRPHDAGEDCGPTVYCAACDEIGHIAVSPTCPSRLPPITHLLKILPRASLGQTEYARMKLSANRTRSKVLVTPNSPPLTQPSCPSWLPYERKFSSSKLKTRNSKGPSRQEP